MLIPEGVDPDFARVKDHHFSWHYVDISVWTIHLGPYDSNPLPPFYGYAKLFYVSSGSHEDIEAPSPHVNGKDSRLFKGQGIFVKHHQGSSFKDELRIGVVKLHEPEKVRPGVKNGREEEHE